jgi:hypothetical protein
MPSFSRRTKVLPPDPAQEMAKCDARIEALEARLRDLGEAPVRSPTPSGAPSGGVASLEGSGSDEPRPVVKLPPEDIASLVQRLTKPIVPPETPGDMLLPSERPGAKKRDPLSPDDVAALVERLGVNDLERRSASRAELWQKEVDTLPLTVVLAAKGEYCMTKIPNLDEQDMINRRLAAEFMEKKNEKIAELRASLYHPLEVKKMSASAVKASVERMSTETMAKHDEETLALRAKYMAEVPKRRLTKEQQQQCADRLCKRN